MIEYAGWSLVSEPDRDNDGFDRWDHYAVKGDKKVHLKGSPFLSSFEPDQAQFQYLVDHGFPSAPRGNWFSYELKELLDQQG